jgi:hypothetical protein
MSHRSTHHSDIQMTLRGFGIPPPPAHDTAVPATQLSQHYGEQRAITQLDYDGAQTAGSENFNPPQHHRSMSRSHSRHHRGSRPSSKAPDITILGKRCTAYLLAFRFYFDSSLNHEWGWRAHTIRLPRPSSRPTSSQ